MSSLTDMLATHTKTRNMCQFQEKVKVISQLWLEVLRVGGKRTLSSVSGAELQELNGD